MSALNQMDGRDVRNSGRLSNNISRSLSLLSATMMKPDVVDLSGAGVGK